jgi:hypothetical protein
MDNPTRVAERLREMADKLDAPGEMEIALLLRDAEQRLQELEGRLKRTEEMMDGYIRRAETARRALSIPEAEPPK